jgi:hypothetical protein
VDDTECDLNSHSYGDLYDQQLHSDSLGRGRSIRGIGDAIEQGGQLWEFCDLYGNDECGLYGFGL